MGSIAIAENHIKSQARSVHCAQAMDVSIVSGARKGILSKTQLTNRSQPLKISRVDNGMLARLDLDGSVNDVSDFHVRIPEVL
jgi:hypothetical protein